MNRSQPTSPTLKANHYLPLEQIPSSQELAALLDSTQTAAVRLYEGLRLEIEKLPVHSKASQERNQATLHEGFKELMRGLTTLNTLLIQRGLR